MIAARLRRSSRWLLLLAVPATLIATGEIAARRALQADPGAERAELSRRIEACRSFFDGLFRETLGAAEATLARGPLAASDEFGRGSLGRRLQGVGLADPDGRLTDWEGTPSEPPPRAPGDRDASWRILTEGLRTSLVACSARDPATGLAGVASYLLDSPVRGGRLEELLPAARRFEFAGLTVGAEARAPVGAGSAEDEPIEGGEVVGDPVRAPSGEVVAIALFREIPAGHAAARARSLGGAWAAVALATLLGVLFPWPSLVRTPAGFLAGAAAIATVRGALLLARSPSHLLSRELASPTLFGSPGLGGALASPADLALTCLAGFLIALALRGPLKRQSQPRATLLLVLAAGAGATVATGCLLGLARVLARDARVPILDLEAAAVSPPRALLLLSLLLTVLAAATLWGAFSRASFAALGRPIRGCEALGAFGSLLPLALLGILTLQGEADRIAVERLQSEFAPQVLDQTARRQLALVSAVSGAAASSGAAKAVLGSQEAADLYAAYRLWVGGDLFHAGFASSLDLYDLSGALRSHFGFDLPQLPDEHPPRAEPVGPLEAKPERFLIGASRRWVQHAEAPILSEGRAVGAVVGHVLEEPDNLPFLPWVAPYLLALGPGSSRLVEAHPEVPAYVRYDRDGAVVVTTLHQPPALTADVREAARTRRTLRIEAGDERYLALPLAESEGVHLLLVPARSWLDRVGALARVLLLAAGLLGLLGAARLAARPAGLAALAGIVKSSFYRKLLASLLLASVLPVLGLAVFLRFYIEQRGHAAQREGATGLVRAVKRQVEDYAALQPGPLNDEVLAWLRRVIGQEIHLYERGWLEATSKPELFSSGLLSRRLPGDVERQVLREGLPYLVRDEPLGPNVIPVVYAGVQLPATGRESVVAVPLILQQQEAARAVDRVEEVLLLATIVLCGLPAAAGAVLARRAVRPVRELVAASSRIASGDYSARLEARTRDEIAALVEAFNAMAAALAAQREDLVRRRDYMEALLRHATTGVVSTDPEGRVVTVNPAAAALLASSTGTPQVGEVLAEAVSRSTDLRPLAEALREPASRSGDPSEVDLERRGEVRRLRLVRVDLPDPRRGTAGELILIEDVTELMRSNQLAAWAEMARAIAHEVKNPLTPILLSAEHLERILRDRGILPAPEIQACLETIVKQVRALREISAEFSAYAKLPTLEPRPTDPAEFLREALAPYRAAHPPGIEIEETYEPTPRVPIDPRVLSRAILNLVENALQAMPDGGRLRVGVRPVEKGASLFVADTGPGLDPAIRARLFEPYFSTKSSGTGLGLAIARRAVEAHGGRIEVESVRGGGTTFRIVLPAS